MLSTFISVKTRLPDLCTDTWNYAFELRRGRDPGKADVIKTRLSGLFRLLDKQAKMAGVEQADVQQAKFALCAYIDEIVLGSGWALTSAWTPLCQDYYGEAAAGDNFYTRLEGLRHSKETRKRDLLEVYYLCLALGFTGKLSDARGLESRKVLLDGICRELRGEGKPALSVQIRSPDDLPGLRRNRPGWLVPAACLALLVALYVALSVTLSRLVT
jgi:type VI secretion system protein ImpK